MLYEVIFHGQTSATQSLADKAIWVNSLSFDETDIDEPDKVAKFNAACVRLAFAANEIDLLITDGLNRHNYEALQKDIDTAKVLATESGVQWLVKKQKDLELVKNLKATFLWDALFEGIDKQNLLDILNQHYEKNVEFRLSVDNAASHRVSYITELALKKKLEVTLAPVEMMTKKFKAYVLEECAGVLAIRLKGYKHAFYLAKLNLATATIATTIFSIETEAHNEILGKINNTVLTFYTPSQYKLISNPQHAAPMHTHRSKEQPAQQYSLNMAEEQKSLHVDTQIALTAFFGSTTIPMQAKLDVLFRIISHNNVETSTTQGQTTTAATVISGQLGFAMASGTPTQKNQSNSSSSSSNNNTTSNSSNNASTASTVNFS